jgi:hypothetical protein
MHFLAQAPFRADAEALADKQHPDHRLGINRGSAHRTVEWPAMPTPIRKINKPIDRA